MGYEMKYKSTLAVIALLLSGTAASAQEACSVYTVKPGDSLSGIVKAAYGNNSFQGVWDANRTTIGSNPNLIYVGVQLRLPCADGKLPGASVTTATAVAPQSAPAGEPISIRLVTGSDYAPFTDESMEGGGIYTQLVRAAMDTMKPDVTTTITFVNDWGAHLETLLPAVAFDGAFPWLRPNCEAPEALTENSKFRCEEFLHSDPFYEIVNALSVKSSSPLATTANYTDFHGTKICLPDGYSDSSLAAAGLVEPKVTYVQPVNPDDCFVKLIAGDVDAVSLEVRQAEDIAQRLGNTDQVAANKNLTVINTLSIFISKKHPNGADLIKTINQGLKNIHENGIWFNTVRKGFSAYYKKG